jgi:16S rRNA processing protein RimM
VTPEGEDLPAGTGEDKLRIGRVLRAHGVRGVLGVEPLTDFLDRFTPGVQVFVDDRPLTIASMEQAEGALLLRFREVGDRTEAEKLAGAYLTLPLAQARRLPDDHFYHFELIGMEVLDASSGRQLGTVAEVLTYPANDVLRVSGLEGEVLVPMVKAIVRSVDKAARQIHVDLPEEVEVR